MTASLRTTEAPPRRSSRRGRVSGRPERPSHAQYCSCRGQLPVLSGIEIRTVSAGNFRRNGPVRQSPTSFPKSGRSSLSRSCVVLSFVGAHLRSDELSVKCLSVARQVHNLKEQRSGTGGSRICLTIAALKDARKGSSPAVVQPRRIQTAVQGGEANTGCDRTMQRLCSTATWSSLMTMRQGSAF